MLKLAQKREIQKRSRFLFPEKFWKIFRRNWISKFWIKNWFQWPKLSGNWPNTAIQGISRFPDNFWKIFMKTRISKFWIKNWFQWPKLSWNDTKLTQNRKFQIISIFHKISGKLEFLKFWAQNRFQWQKLRGNDTQDVGIGPKQHIPEIFPISRKFLEEFLEN